MNHKQLPKKPQKNESCSDSPQAWFTHIFIGYQSHLATFGTWKISKWPLHFITHECNTLVHKVRGVKSYCLSVLGLQNAKGSDHFHCTVNLLHSWVYGITAAQVWFGVYSRKSGGITWGGSQTGQTQRNAVFVWGWDRRAFVGTVQ